MAVQQAQYAGELQELIIGYGPHTKDPAFGDAATMAAIVNLILADNQCLPHLNRLNHNGNAVMTVAQYRAFLREMSRAIAAGNHALGPRLIQHQNGQNVRHAVRAQDQNFAAQMMATYRAQTNAAGVRNINLPAQYGLQMCQILAQSEAMNNNFQGLHAMLRVAFLRGNAGAVGQAQTLRIQKIIADYIRELNGQNAPSAAAQAAFLAVATDVFVIEYGVQTAPNYTPPVALAGQAQYHIGDQNVCYLLTLIHMLICANGAVPQAVAAGDIDRLMMIVAGVFSIRASGRFTGGAGRRTNAAATGQAWLIQAVAAQTGVHIDPWKLTSERILRVFCVFRKVALPESIICVPNATIAQVFTYMAGLYNQLMGHPIISGCVVEFCEDFACCFDKFLLGRDSLFRIPNPGVDQRGILQ